MEKIMIKDCPLNKEYLNNVLAIGTFGSYHEECFDKNRSDIDVMILLKKELDFNDEFEIEDYLNSILPEYFKHDFNYPFSELLLMSNDKIIFDEEKYLDYLLGYSTFKRDREPLEVIRNKEILK